MRVLSERGASSTQARLLAQRENEADLIGGVNLGAKDRYLAETLLDLSQTATINDSLKVGRAVPAELGGFDGLFNTTDTSSLNFGGSAPLSIERDLVRRHGLGREPTTGDGQADVRAADRPAGVRDGALDDGLRSQEESFVVRA